MPGQVRLACNYKDPGYLFELRQPFTVGFDQIVAELADIVNGQFGAGVGIEHGGVVDVVLLTGKGRLQG